MRISSRIKHKPGNVSKEDEDLGVDDVLVERAVSQGNVRLNRAELREAVRILSKRGASGYQIARQLGCTSDTVYRHLKALSAQSLDDKKPV